VAERGEGAFARAHGEQVHAIGEGPPAARRGGLLNGAARPREQEHHQRERKPSRRLRSFL
jgi:hypothetical protein